MTLGSAAGCVVPRQLRRPMGHRPGATKRQLGPEFGIDLFCPAAGGGDELASDVVVEGVFAEELGLDFIELGDLHGSTLAAYTGRIRLGTTIAIVGSDDTRNVQDRIGELDAVSHGRAEVVLGGVPRDPSVRLDHDIVLAGALDLFAAVRGGRPGVRAWSGPASSVLERGPLPAWVGVSGTPGSVIQAAGHGLPIMLTVAAGDPRRFADVVDRFRSTATLFGAPGLRVGLRMPGFLAETDERAIEYARPRYEDHTRFVTECGPDGGLLVGGPESVARKIARAVGALGVSRFVLTPGSALPSHEQRVEFLRLYATEVVPRVRALLRG